MNPYLQNILHDITVRLSKLEGRMTPEETLDWLAQQHYEQCREVRPIQDWIRKMKSQLPENNSNKEKSA